MKFIPKTLALMLACSAVGLAQAVSVTWDTNNLTSTFNTYELDAAIRLGLESADSSLPELPKPWRLKFTLDYRGTNDYQAEPGLILVQKIRVTPSGRFEEACKRMRFGTFTKTMFLEQLRDEAKFTAGYVTTTPGCIVNDPEPVASQAAPAKKSSKK